MTEQSKNIQVITYERWEHFKNNVGLDLFEDGIFKRNRFLFRGQRKAEWDLVTSFDRIYHQYDPGRKREIESFLIREFREEIEDLEILPDSEDSIIPFAQHHGIPTRLLDWTLSPYVAAFFAFVNILFSEDNSSHAAIWVLDTESSIWHEELGVRIISPPRIGNIRLRNQQGKFTLSKTPFASLEKYVDQFDDAGTPLIQMLIPSRDVRKAYSELDLMGINYSNLFPGPDGQAKSVLMRATLQFSNGVQ
jgi:hypothetical protein